LCNHGKSKGSLAYKIPKSVQYGYDDSFKLMVIKYAKATSDCATAWGCVSQTEYMTFKKTNRAVIKGSKCNPKSILWAQAEEV